LEAIPKSPRSKFAGFFTHSTYTQDVSRNSFDSFASKCAISFENAGKEKQIDFRGNYNCQGAPSPTIKESIRKYFIEVLKSAEGWEEYIKGASKHPTPKIFVKLKNSHDTCCPVSDRYVMHLLKRISDNTSMWKKE